MSFYRKTIKKIAPLLLVLLAAVVYIASCQMRSPADPPPDPPADGEAAPQIPPEIDRGERQEPVISVYIAERGVIEEMAMEDYITGVVAGEMDPNWPVGALASQAILARTFTMQKIAEAGGVPQRNAHASTDIEEFQAYSAEDITDRVREAVNATRGEVACYNNEFIRAWFHAFAGPRTALADEGLDFEGGNPPYIHIVDSPGVDIVPEEEGNWSASFPLSQIRQSVTEITGNDPGAVESMEIGERGPSGRVTTFTINGQDVSANAIRLALGSTVMRSTFLDELSVVGDTVYMSGSGYGHGVGMCQWGARALAEDGMSPEEIVDYFYNRITIVSLWD